MFKFTTKSKSHNCREKIGEVRLYVTPRDIRYGCQGSEGNCPIARAILRQLGAQKVGVGSSEAVAFIRGFGWVTLFPIESPYRKRLNMWNFVDAFDAGVVEEIPERIDFTFEVFKSIHRDKYIHGFTPETAFVHKM